MDLHPDYIYSYIFFHDRVSALMIHQNLSALVQVLNNVSVAKMRAKCKNSYTCSDHLMCYPVSSCGYQWPTRENEEAHFNNYSFPYTCQLR